jgi:hypothetical protein
MTDAVPKSTKSKRLLYTSDPKDELKNFSVGIVSTMLRTDLRIALSFFKIGRSFVIGWGKNDKLMSLNSLETRLIDMN